MFYFYFYFITIIIYFFIIIIIIITFTHIYHYYYYFILFNLLILKFCRESMEGVHGHIELDVGKMGFLGR